VDNKIEVIMASEPDVCVLAKRFLQSYRSRYEKGIPLYVLKSLISSPRLFDVCWREFKCDEFVAVGDSFLDQHTMLADGPQKTYAISLDQWIVLQDECATVSDYRWDDKTISIIQVWPYDARRLSFDQLALAVAVSYTEVELLAEPRLCGALNDLLSVYGVESYWEPRLYG
jgi:hypothetical protein